VYVVCRRFNVHLDDDDDRDGHRNGILRTPNVADSPRRLHQINKVAQL